VIVTDLPVDALAVLRSEAEQQGIARSPGLHLSDIYRDIEAIWEKRVELDEKERANYFAGGFLWEHAFSQGLARALTGENVVRPPELYLDGVIGSPDLIDFAGWFPIDTKFTWRSERKLAAIERWFWPWTVQACGYIRMMQRYGPCHASEMYVFFANGDYAPPRPSLRHLRLEFGQEEIEEKWEMCIKHARTRGWL
jgi:hypothetical protein